MKYKTYSQTLSLVCKEPRQKQKRKNEINLKIESVMGKRRRKTQRNRRKKKLTS